MDLPPTYTSERVERAVADPAPRVLYVNCRDGVAYSVTLRCPCGCNDVLTVNTDYRYEPAWRFTEHADKTISLYPFIKRSTGCKARISVAYNVVQIIKEKVTSSA